MITTSNLFESTPVRVSAFVLRNVVIDGNNVSATVSVGGVPIEHLGSDRFVVDFADTICVDDNCDEVVVYGYISAVEPNVVHVFYLLPDFVSEVVSAPAPCSCEFTAECSVDHNGCEHILILCDSIGVPSGNELFCQLTRVIPVDDDVVAQHPSICLNTVGAKFRFSKVFTGEAFIYKVELA